MPLIICTAAAGLLLLASAALALLVWRRRVMKSRSEKIYSECSCEQDQMLPVSVQNSEGPDVEC